MNIDFYKTVPKLQVTTKKHRTLYLIRTEERKITDDLIMNTVIKADIKKVTTIFKLCHESDNVVPTIRDVVGQLIALAYFPSMVKSEQAKQIRNRAEWTDYLRSIAQIVTNDLFSMKNREKTENFIGNYLRNILDLYASPAYVTEGGLCQHVIATTNMSKSKKFGMRKTINFSKLWHHTMVGITNCLDSEELSRKEQLAVIDWYIDYGELFVEEKARDAFVKMLFGEYEKGKTLVLDIAIRYRENLKDAYTRHPEYDLYDNCYKEYENVESFALAAGYDLAEIFPEKSPTDEEHGHSCGVRTPGENKPEKRHALDVLNSLDTLYRRVDSNDKVIINFGVKTDETEKVQVFGKYIGIAFFLKEQWWILVDSIKPNNAIYLWHGDSYQEGINVFGRSKAFARNYKEVLKRNHRETIKTFDKYQKMLEAVL